MTCGLSKTILTMSAAVLLILSFGAIGNSTGADDEDTRLEGSVTFHMELGDDETLVVEGEEYELTLTVVEEDHAVLTIGGSPFTLQVNETRELDLDDDDEDEVEVTLMSTAGGVAEVRFTFVLTNEDLKYDMGDVASQIMLWALMALIMGLIIGYVYSRSREVKGGDPGEGKDMAGKRPPTKI